MVCISSTYNCFLSSNHFSFYLLFINFCFGRIFQSWLQFNVIRSCHSLWSWLRSYVLQSCYPLSIWQPCFLQRILLSCDWYDILQPFSFVFILVLLNLEINQDILQWDRIDRSNLSTGIFQVLLETGPNLIIV